MKVHLMYQDRDFDIDQQLPPHEQVLTQDLELNTLFNAMARGDEFLFKVAKQAVLTSLIDLDTILYRQDILKDCLKNPSIVRDLYEIAGEAIENKKKHYWGIFSKQASSILYNSLEMMQLFLDMLKKMKNIVHQHAGQFASEGFRAFFSMINEELSDEYFKSIQYHLRELKFRGGVLISAELGKGNKGTNYILRKAPVRAQTLLDRFFAAKLPAYTFYIHERDESGARALSELRDRGINLAANALGQSTDHIFNFIVMLRTELAFYVGCLNLHTHLAGMGEPIAFPQPKASGERRHRFKGLYDVCLALRLEQSVVGNDMNADNKDAVIITGANQGGKSTFLRSIGISQLMMQCGMFVPAESFTSNICDGCSWA